MIKAYLDGGDRDGFGSRNPFDNFSGEGGTEGLAKALAVDVKTSDCPDEDTRFSAMLFGKLVGASSIGPEDRMMLQMFMEVAYEDNVTAFNKGLSMIKAVRARRRWWRPPGRGMAPERRAGAEAATERGAASIPSRVVVRTGGEYDASGRARGA
jgi:hypothetical protein